MPLQVSSSKHSIAHSMGVSGVSGPAFPFIVMFVDGTMYVSSLLSSAARCSASSHCISGVGVQLWSVALLIVHRSIKAFAGVIVTSVKVSTSSQVLPDDGYLQ